MLTRGRRRLDVALLGAGALAAGVVSAVGALAADTERVTGMWVGASLTADGRAEVQEVVDYDFGALAQDKHGIFRRIPGLTTDDAVEVASASAPDGVAAETPVLIDGEPGVELKIGDPARTVSGRHRYRIAYAHPHLVDDGRLRWDAVGTGWSVPVAQSEVHVVAPWRFTGLSCSKGATGTTGGCELTQPEPGHLVVEVGRLDSGQGITITAQRGEALAAAPALPAPPLRAPPDPGAGLALPVVTGAGAAALAGATASRLVRRRGRERVAAGGVAEAAWADSEAGTGEVLVDVADLADMATTEFAPPQGLTAPMGGILLTERVASEHQVAWLIEAAIAGAVDLVEDDGRAVRLVRRSGGDPAADAPLERMFSGRPELPLGAYDADFAAGWSQVAEQLKGWQARSGLWDPDADRRQAGVRIVGVLAAVIGTIGLGVGAAATARWGAEWLPLVALGGLLAGAGGAAALRGWELKVRTPEGSGLWLRVESFRRFLAASEATHAEEAARRGVLREYTAWAVAVGEIDRWERAVSASSAIPAQAGLGYVHMAPLLMSSATTATTAPSSSGGGGGGISVGGGGGGGGGGSW